MHVPAVRRAGDRGGRVRAVLNLTLLREVPDAGNMIGRLLDPMLREGLPAAELTRLTDAVALGLHNNIVLAGVLSVVALCWHCWCRRGSVRRSRRTIERLRRSALSFPTIRSCSL